jgi:uncharacterized protein YjiS (DUF1127 family)
MDQTPQSTASPGWLARMSTRFCVLWHEAAARCEVERLDATALRDLGLDSSELPSYLAEATGEAERTRRRVREIEWG